MSSSFFARSAVRFAVFNVLALAGIGACGKGPASNGGPGSVACPPPPPPDPDGGFALYQGFASGSASGSGVSATLCNAGIQLSGPAARSGPLQFALDTSGPFASTDIRLPAGAVGGTMTALIQAGAPAAGIYRSSDAKACGVLTFSYGTLTVPGANCNAHPGTACPTGCTSTFICAGAAPPCCVPLAKTFVYQATAPSGCTGATQAPIGSWTLTLTSVAPYEDGGTHFGESFYVPHGTLTATLKGTTDTTDTASISLSF